MIAVTMGDASGVGPELALKGFAEGIFSGDVVVIGDIAALERARAELNINLEFSPLSVGELEAAAGEAPSGEDRGVSSATRVPVVDLGLLDAKAITPGVLSREAGAAAIEYVRLATDLALRGTVSAIVTLPINKEATGMSVSGFSGHTEFIAEQCGAKKTTMMLASDQLIVTHVSTHVSIRTAAERCRRARILEVIELTAEATMRLRGEARIAVAGLNPHAGEHGQFGSEEIDEIAPAVADAQGAGYSVDGPIAADTVFYRVLKGGAYDAVVCMYHDQGHIPMKTIDFDGGVNVTLGLPIIRTSVDHGTAFDIAYTGVVRTRSLAAAYAMARRLGR